MALFALLMVAFLSVTYAHKADVGSCPTITPMKNFNIQKFLGTWHVLYKVKTKSACVKNFFYEDDSSDDLKVTEQRYMDTVLGEGAANLTSGLKITGIPGIMQVKYHTVVPNAAFRVMATDYSNYAMIFKCQSLVFFHRWSVSIMARDPNYNDENIITSLLALMESEDLDSSQLDRIDHNGCDNVDDVDLSVSFEGDDFNLDVDGKYIDSVKDAAEVVGGVIKDAAAAAAQEVLHQTADVKENEVANESMP